MTGVVSHHRLSLPAVNATNNLSVNLLSQNVLLDPTSPAAVSLYTTAGSYITLNVGSYIMCLQHEAQTSHSQVNLSGEAAADACLFMVLAELQGLEEISGCQYSSFPPP